MSLFSQKKEMEMEKNKESNSCEVCHFFESRTHFCRLNPPTPVIYLQIEKDENGDQIFINKAGSKYPVIGLPELDFCSKFKRKMFLD
jgi:hypothetical protein